MIRSDIKPGDILVNQDGNKYYVVLNSDGKLYIMSTTIFVVGTALNNMLSEDLSTTKAFSTIIEIRNNYGETLWQKPVELTLQEIADKFGIPVEQLRIKK
jgi:DNA-binding beta-propeller fold protein YncE